MIDDYMSIVIFAILLTLSFLTLTYKNYADAIALESSIANSERKMYAELALSVVMLSWDPSMKKELFLEVIEGYRSGTYRSWNVSEKIDAYLLKYFSHYNYKIILEGDVIDGVNHTSNYTNTYSLNLPEGYMIVLEVQE